MSLAASRTAPHPTPLSAIFVLTFLASIGTGVVWNGVAFIAKHDYKFSELQTLALYAVLGGTYIAGAASTGPILRAISRRMSPRTALAVILTCEAAVCIALAASQSDWMLWVVACSISVLSSWLWPIVESYLTAGRHGAAMRHAIGWWNLSWTGAVAAALVLMMPVMQSPPAVIDVLGWHIRLEPRVAIVVLGALHLVALIPLAWFSRTPAAHSLDEAHEVIQPEYRHLLRAARVLLPLSYVLNSAMSPLLPYLFERIELEQQWETPVTSTWMWVRIVAMACMWRLGFWHGRWGTLLLGGLCMTAGFACVVLAHALVTIIIGLGLFGTGMGIVYYAALYYAMAVGNAEVDAGGTHEALIGLGYTIGPIASMSGLALGAQARDAGVDIWNGAGVVTIVLLLLGLGVIGAVRPYLQARAKRMR